MWLVLAPSSDVAAAWVWEGLRNRGLDPVELVAAEALGCCRRLEHRVGQGEAYFRFTLPDGREIDSREVRGVINRLTAIPSSHFERASKEDRLYADQEFFAFSVSSLHSFSCPVLNPPTPFGLGGVVRHQSEWIWLCSMAGIPMRPYTYRGEDGASDPVASYMVPTETVIVCEGQTSGANAPPEVADACVRLAEIAATPLLGIDFLRNGDGHWMFATATSHPDLRQGGEALIDKLFAVLSHKQES